MEKDMEEKTVTVPIDCRDAFREPSKGTSTGVGDDGNPAYCVTARGAVQAVCNVAPTLTSSNSSPPSSEGTLQVMSVHKATAQVRRLTPVECERLQGFPDNYTRIPWKGKTAEECPDGPRYKAIGNSWAVPCVAWIGRRIDIAMQYSEL